MTVPTPTHSWKFDETTGNIAADSTGSADITLDRDDCWVPRQVRQPPPGQALAGWLRLANEEAALYRADVSGHF